MRYVVGVSFPQRYILRTCCLLVCLRTRWQARRNLSDHARLLAALPSEESEVADTAEHEYQHQQYSRSAHGFPPGEGAWARQDRDGGAGAGAGEADEDGMAVDGGEVRGSSRGGR